MKKGFGQRSRNFREMLLSSKALFYYVRIPDRIRQELFVEACNLVFKAQFAVYGSDDTLHLTHREHSSEE